MANEKENRSIDRVALLNRQKNMKKMLLKQNVLSSSSVKFELSSSKITTLLADLYGTPQMKIKELELKGLLRQFLAHLEFFWIGLLSYYLAHFKKSLSLDCYASILLTWHTSLFDWIVTLVSCAPRIPFDWIGTFVSRPLLQFPFIELLRQYLALKSRAFLEFSSIGLISCYLAHFQFSF